MKIDWDKVWVDFEKWFEKRDAGSECKNVKHDTPEWDEQMEKIQKLVDKQLKK